jgi:hypothetical protein
VARRPKPDPADQLLLNLSGVERIPPKKPKPKKPKPRKAATARADTKAEKAKPKKATRTKATRKPIRAARVVLHGQPSRPRYMVKTHFKADLRQRTVEYGSSYEGATPPRSPAPRDILAKSLGHRMAKATVRGVMRGAIALGATIISPTHTPPNLGVPSDPPAVGGPWTTTIERARETGPEKK